MVAEAPLEDSSMVAIPGGGEPRRDGWLCQSGDVWLVLWLANGVSNMSPWFEGSAASVVAQTPVMLDDYRAQAEWHTGRALAYALTVKADGHTGHLATVTAFTRAEVNDGYVAAAKQLGDGPVRRALRWCGALHVETVE